MTSGPVALTVGWIGRHTPPGAGVDVRSPDCVSV